MNYNKIAIVITLLCIVLPITNAVTPYTTFNTIPNYKSYVNITVNSFNATMPFGANTIDLGAVGYFYINTGFNSTLHNTPYQYLELAGFSNGNFLGNITAYPFANGLIVANKTIEGNAYNTVTLFYNQITPAVTYLNKTNIAQIAHLSSAEIYLYNMSGVTYTLSTVNNYTLGITNLKFNNQKIPYYLIGNSTSDNFTMVHYLNTPISQREYGYSLKGTSAILNTSTTFSSPLSVTATQSSLFAYFSADGYYAFATEGLAVFGATKGTANIGGAIINATTSKYGIGLFYGSYNYYMSFYQPNVYYFVPAYSTNITLSTNQIVPAPISPNSIVNTTDCGPGWYYDFEYRQPVNNIVFNATFTTQADPSHLGTPYQLNFTNTKYVMLNLTHYTHMGNNCENIYIEAFDSDYATPLGSVPFAVYGVCNATKSKISLVLPNKTSTGNVYNSIYVYFYSNSNMTGFNNQSLLGNFILGNGNYFTVSSTIPFLIQLTAPLNSASHISTSTSDRYGAGSFTWLTSQSNTYGALDYINSTGYHFVYLSGYLPDYHSISDTINTNRAFLIDGQSLYTHTLSVTSSGLSNVTNTVSSGVMVVDGTPSTTIALIGIKATAMAMYSSIYTIGAYQHYNGCGANSTYNNSTTNELPFNTSKSNLPSQSQNFYYNIAHINATLTNMHLTANVKFLGTYTIPTYAVLIITVIGTILAVAVAHDEANLMLIFIVFWIIGLYNVGFTILALMLTLVYGVYNFVHKHKKSGNHE